MTREDGKHINPASTYNGGIKQQLEFSNKSRNPQNLGRDAKKSIISPNTHNYIDDYNIHQPMQSNLRVAKGVLHSVSVI